MSTNKEVLHEGNYLGLYRRDDWEFAERPNSTSVVGILAITDDSEIVLIEQHRHPVNQRVIEIPAGLVGDEPEHEGEALEDTANRELLEETGYHARSIEPLLSSPTSAGMTSEITHLFFATELIKKGEGGGTENENITVHHVPVNFVDAWLAERQAEGCLIDFKIHAALWCATQFSEE